MADRSIFVVAGRRGAEKRWGPPRVVRLDDLRPNERRLLLALLDAVRAEQAAPVVETSGTATAGGRHATVEPAA
jgi:hypothetical protein